MLPSAVYKKRTQIVGCSHRKVFAGHIFKIRCSTRDDDTTWSPKVAICCPTDAVLCPRRTEYWCAPLQCLRKSHIKNGTHCEFYRFRNLRKRQFRGYGLPVSPLMFVNKKKLSIGTLWTTVAGLGTIRWSWSLGSELPSANFQFCFSVHHIMINKNTSLMQLISVYFTYSKSLHVSGRTMPIIRRTWYCTYQRLVLVR